MTIGGYKRDPLVPQLGLFIRDALINGEVTWSHKLFTEYKAAVAVIPKRAGGKRKLISYESFRRYIAAMRTLQLIEYVSDTQPPTEEPTLNVKGGALTSGRLLFRMVPGAESSLAWQNIWRALRP